MKVLWIIDHYASEPKYGGISRQYDFACELGKRGIKVVVISSGYSHFTHSYISDKDVLINRVEDNVFFIYLKTHSYASNNGKDRALNMIDFMFKVEKQATKIAEEFGKPDTITGCSVHPLAWIAAHKLSKRYKARFVAEVRDFWPQQFIASGLNKPYDPMMVFFDVIQKWTYKKADRIIYSMSHGDRYLCDALGVNKDKCFLIGQPMDCERFDKNRDRTYLIPEDIREFMKDGFICSFAGYYMDYEGVYVMLQALKILEDKGLPVKMIFVGSGEEKEGMCKYIADNKIKGALVWDRISKEGVPALISHSDICLAHLEAKGFKDVYKYGVSKNKVNEYLYSGTCTLYGFLYKDDEVATSGGGLMFEPFDTIGLANRIEQVYNMPEDQRRLFGVRGREYIKSTRSVEVLTDQMLNVLFG